MLFGRKWKLSERKYNVTVEHDVSIPVSDGVVIDSELFRPDTAEKVPVVLGVHGYAKGNYSYSVGHESGIPHLFCRRGYAHMVINVRGSGKSTGEYTNYGPLEVKDTYEVIQWIGDQPWCDGNVVMWGVSYFGVAQLQIAALNPPHLKAIVPISSYTDFYRMKFYPEGIYWHAFTKTWGGNIYWESKSMKLANWSREKMGETKYEEAVAQALRDRDICAVQKKPHTYSCPSQWETSWAPMLTIGTTCARSVSQGMIVPLILKLNRLWREAGNRVG